MIYEAPPLSDADHAVLAEIDKLRSQLRFVLVEPRRWYGTLRRVTMAGAVQGSNTIEGYHASVEDVAAILDAEEPHQAGAETQEAIAGYRDALTYVLQLAAEPQPLDRSTLLALHFMMMRYDLTSRPGRWRPGAVWVENNAGDVVYQAPDREEVETLLDELLVWARSDTGPALVHAAMLHLNLTLIHPFSDGNGRMARCLQTHALACNGLLSPIFASIEEYLGQHTGRYYEVLTAVAAGRWSPERDTRPWIEFCLTAHYRQARLLLRRIDETEALWDRCEQVAQQRGLLARSVAPLCDAARGWRLTRRLYVKSVRVAAGESLSDTVASRDLRALVDAGLLTAVGERRGRVYQPSPELRAMLAEIRAGQPPLAQDDPYVPAR